MKMKRLLIAFIGIFLILPLIVNADMGAPMFTQYDVRVTNLEGTDVVDFDNKYVRTLKYDEVWTIVYETIIDGEIYGGSPTEMVKLSDTEMINKEFDKSKLKKEIKKKYFVFDKGAYLYNGPSKLYGKVESELELPIGFEFESEYYDQLWTYVTYNGVSGWVYSYEYKAMSPYDELSSLAISISNYYMEENNKIMTLRDLKMIDSPKTDVESSITIPKYTEFDVKYIYYERPRATYYYITYNGTNGWIKNEIDYNGIEHNIAQKTDKYSFYTLNEDGINLYKDYNSKTNVLKNIPYGTELKVDYVVEMGKGSFALSYLVKYDDEIGWIFIDDNYNNQEIVDTNINFKSYYKVEKELTVYEKPNQESNAIEASIDVGTKILVKYSYTDASENTWFYTEHNNVNGWIKKDNNLEFINDESVEDNQTENITDETTENVNNKLEPLKIVGICAISAIILSLVSYVTILLVNKKKKGLK